MSIEDKNQAQKPEETQPVSAEHETTEATSEPIHASTSVEITSGSDGEADGGVPQGRLTEHGTWEFDIPLPQAVRDAQRKPQARKHKPSVSADGAQPPLMDISVDLVPYVNMIEPDLEAYREIVRSDWDLDEIICFAYLSAISNYNIMLTRLLNDPDMSVDSVKQVTRVVRAALGARFQTSTARV